MRGITLNVPHFSDFDKCSSGSRIPGYQLFACLVSVDLKVSLVPDPVNWARPRDLHEGTGHILPQENNLLQFYISDPKQFVQENNMVIKKDKTK